LKGKWHAHVKLKELGKNSVVVDLEASIFKQHVLAIRGIFKKIKGIKRQRA